MSWLTLPTLISVGVTPMLVAGPGVQAATPPVVPPSVEPPVVDPPVVAARRGAPVVPGGRVGAAIDGAAVGATGVG